jgi:hypothetical protein
MNACQIRARERDIGNSKCIRMYEVNHTGRQSGCLQEFHDIVGRQRGRWRRLPEDRVAHQRWSTRQIARDGREIEWGESKDKSLERAVVTTIPNPVDGDRLLTIYPLHIVNIEAKKID